MNPTAPIHRICLVPLAVLFALMAGCTQPPQNVPSEASGYPFAPADFAPFVTPVEFTATAADPVAEPDEPGEALELSVEQAVMAAFRNNRDLRVERLSPVVDGAFARIERGEFDPELFAEYRYFEEEAQETSRSTGAQFDVAGTESDAVAGLRQRLPTGTSLEAFVSHDSSESDRAPEQQSARVGLSVTQALLQGFGPMANLARLRQAEYESLASRQELRGFAEALLAETEMAYWNYVLAKEEITIFEESLAVARQQLEEIELRIEVGILPEIEVAAARTEEALRVQALIDTRSQLEEQRLRLLRLISPGPGNPFDRQIVTTSELLIGADPFDDLDARLDLAIQSRPDLHEARLRLQQDRLETVVTRNGLLPRLDLFVTYGKTGYADSFSDSFRELNGDTYDLTAGIRLNHVLGSRADRARNLAAFAARQQAAEAVANLKQLVQLDVRLAYNEVERARQQIDATRMTREFQEQTLYAEKERFNVGASTALQVAQAQRDLVRIQIAEVEAIVNYRIALIRLYLAEGTLLQRRGVTIAD